MSKYQTSIGGIQITKIFHQIRVGLENEERETSNRVPIEIKYEDIIFKLKHEVNTLNLNRLYIMLKIKIPNFIKETIYAIYQRYIER